MVRPGPLQHHRPTLMPVFGALVVIMSGQLGMTTAFLDMMKTPGQNEHLSLDGNRKWSMELFQKMCNRWFSPFGGVLFHSVNEIQSIRMVL
jgi:hypothetical protein